MLIPHIVYDFLPVSWFLCFMYFLSFYNWIFQSFWAIYSNWAPTIMSWLQIFQTFCIKVNSHVKTNLLMDHSTGCLNTLCVFSLKIHFIPLFVVSLLFRVNGLNFLHTGPINWVLGGYLSTIGSVGIDAKQKSRFLPKSLKKPKKDSFKMLRTHPLCLEEMFMLHDTPWKIFFQLVWFWC